MAKCSYVGKNREDIVLNLKKIFARCVAVLNVERKLIVH